MKPGRVSENQALLTLSAGRLDLGVPDVTMRPMFVPGCVGKPQMRFNARVI